MPEIIEDLEVLGAEEAAETMSACCDVCGSAWRPVDGIICPACGEAVLGEGWTP